MTIEKREPPWWLTSVVAPVLVASAFGVGSWLVIGAETKSAVVEHERRLGVLEADVRGLHDGKASAADLDKLDARLASLDSKLTQILLILGTGRPK